MANPTAGGRAGSMTAWMIPVGDHTTGPRSAPFDLIGLLGVDRVMIVCDRPRIVGILEAFLEIPDAMGEIAHQPRNVAAATEQERHNHDQDQPVPNAKTAHGLFLLEGLGYRASRWTCAFF